jgi:hypothetical protein
VTRWIGQWGENREDGEDEDARARGGFLITIK